MPNQEKHSILLVDDEPEILFSLTGLLRREFQLFTAQSGREALQILSEHKIQVIMTDQRMPEMTGLELVGRVQDEYPDAVRIVFTGYADIKAVIEAVNNTNLFRYITKPWDPDDLIEILRLAAARYDELRERRQAFQDASAYVQKTASMLRSLASGAGGDPAQIAELAAEGEQLHNRLRPGLTLFGGAS